MLTLADLIQSEQGLRPDRTSLGISEAVVDSRQAISASMFVAIEGGHAFVKAAFDRGAHLALIQDKVDDNIRVLDLTVPFTQGTVIPEAPFAVRVLNSTTSLQKLAAFWRQKFNLRVLGITGSVGKSTTKELVTEVLS